jgi:hypothetical protein
MQGALVAEFARLSTEIQTVLAELKQEKELTGEPVTNFVALDELKRRRGEISNQLTQLTSGHATSGFPEGQAEEANRASDTTTNMGGARNGLRQRQVAKMQGVEPDGKQLEFQQLKVEQRRNRLQSLHARALLDIDAGKIPKPTELTPLQQQQAQGMQRLERHQGHHITPQEETPGVEQANNRNEGITKACATFKGPKPGLVFKTGPTGTGYYTDDPPIVTYGPTDGDPPRVGFTRADTLMVFVVIAWVGIMWYLQNRI